MYVARDEDGEVFIYKTKPNKRKDLGMWEEDIDELDDYSPPVRISNESIFPKSINPKWEDLEPIEVKLVRKNK